MLGKTAGEVLPEATAETINAEDRKLIESGETPVPRRARGRHARQRHPHRHRDAIAGMGADGKPQYLISVIRDVTDRKRHEQRIAHMAHHDPLTDLPNRDGFNECIAATIDLAAASGESFAVLCIDLDRFKAVNDVFGHAAGDALLREVARRLEAVCQGAFLARVGGDEFTIITPTGPQPASRRGAGRAARRGARHRHRRSTAMRCASASPSASPSFRRTAPTRRRWSPTPTPRLFRAKSEARGSIRFFEMAMDTAAAREARAAAGPAQGDRAQRTRAALPAAGA